MTSEKAKMHELVIDRTQWLRGREGSSLRNGNGRQCCLGFALKDAGFTDIEITHFARPSSVCNYHLRTADLKRRFGVFGFLVEDKCLGLNECVSVADTAICHRLMITNDNPLLAEPDREAELTALFAEHGIKVRFIN